MDSQQVIDLVKALIGPVLTGGGIGGLALLYRKFEAETRASLREDLKATREENKRLGDEIRELREDLRKAEAESDQLRKKRGDA